MSLEQNQTTRKLTDMSSNESTLKEVQQLISEKSTSINTSLINRLRTKYSNVEIVDAILEELTARVATIKNRATKFANAILKHSNQSVPLHTLLNRALKYKSKLGLTEPEFEMFTSILHKRIQEQSAPTVSQTEGYTTLNTNISRALGHLETDSNGLTLEQADYPFVQEILMQYKLSKPLHSNVIVQSMLYSDCALQVRHGEFDSQKHNSACYINPVLAAMFMPKITLFDETFLYANIAHIVKCRYEKTPILTAPEYILLYNMLVDPNDIVCSMDNPFKDLRNRVMLQETLWQSVMSFRNGRFYDCVASQFISAADNCKLSSADAPDMIYVGDDVTIIRRLFQAFSFRPIIVASMPIYGTAGIANPGSFPVMMNRVTAIPMISVRLPFDQMAQQQQPFKLSEQLNKPQYYLENNTIVPKVQTILYTRGVMVFHVGRRVFAPKYQTLVEPRNWNNKMLPTITTFEKINKFPVEVENNMIVGNNTQYLRLSSVVTLLLSPTVEDYIIGSQALILEYDSNAQQLIKEIYKYDPILATIRDATTGHVNKPITSVYTNQVVPWYEVAGTTGTIFIYTEVK